MGRGPTAPTRRRLTPALLLVAGLGAAGLLAAPSPVGETQGAPPPPNVLVIVTDDQRRGTMAAMPKTRQIFQGGGVRLTNGLVTTPQCCPSRASIFTGQYVHNHGVTEIARSDELDPTETLQYHLKQAGYRTALFGKFLKGPRQRRKPPYFDRAFMAASKDYDLHHPTQDYFHARRAVRFLRDLGREDADEPWALFVNFRSPHPPFIPARRYSDAPVPGGYEATPAVRERHFGDKNPQFRKARRPWDRRQATATRRGHMRMLMSVDDGVDRIFNELRRSGEVADTLAFYTSDNGFFWGEHGIQTGKFLPYREAVEVPFYIRWPGRLPRGTTDRRLAANIDIAPTIYDAVGIAPSYVPDGRSLLGSDVREWLLLEGPGGSVRRWPRWNDAYYDGRRHFIRWRNGHEEYYDLRHDPWELEGRFFEGPKHRTRIDPRPFRDALDAAADCTGPSCP